MNRNTFLNCIATLILLVLLVMGFLMISALDSLRLRTEKVSEKLANIEAKISKDTNTQNTTVQTPAPPSTSTELGSKGSSNDFQIANLRYYDKSAEPGGSLVTAVMAETPNMNSLVNNESFVSTLWSYCNEALADRDYENLERFEPQLAESWSISEDKLTYTIKLRRGILWHDFKDPVSGKEWKDVEVSSRDFKFYVDVIKNEDTDCAPMRVYLQDIDRVEIISDYEFKVVWKKQYFLSESITLGLSPLPRHLYHAYDGPFDGKKFNDDHERNRIIVGCGPYRFEKWEKGQRIVLKRWEKYYGQKYGVQPPLEELVFELIQHPNTQFQSLLSGKVDRISLTPEQWVNRTNTADFAPGGPISKINYPSMSYSYIGYNLTNPLFQDKRVRQALTCLVDRGRILKDVYKDLGRTITGPFFMDTPYYDKDIKSWPFDLEKAKQLFAEAGWKDSDNDGILDKDGKKFEFNMLGIASSEIQKRTLPIIKEDMARAGVVMNIQNIDWSVYVKRLENKNFEVCMLGWTTGIDPDPYQLWHSSQAKLSASSNHIGFQNPEADKLIEEIRVCFDLKKRIELCHKFHQLLHEEQPYTFLISPSSLLGQSSRYRNVRVFSTGVPTQIMWEPASVRRKESSGL
ncbi:MAG: hypothetical protein A2X49_12285 [Lentisphaerae bacterium GWF2_52_8]|nr:MAG: hypothetical protein A2X49_12285 [Lentisphaerae bacterium GWF2_52_8]